jgi:SAM-dependent methyltransferase
MSQMSRYQDYVIRDGEFIGEFESMYQRFEDPWHQSAAEHNVLSQARNAVILKIRKYDIRSVVEFGSGLGCFTEMIRDQTGAKVLGVDISETAVTTARSRFPKCEFAIDQISNLQAYRDYDAVLFAEITWYILPVLSQVFTNLMTYFAGKFFLHNLTFYRPGIQQYGREYFTDLDGFVAYCPFQLLEWMSASSTAADSTIETSSLFNISAKSSRKSAG